MRTIEPVLPFGIFNKGENYTAAGVAIGEFILDLATMEDAGLFSSIGLPNQVFRKRYLNDFIALGKDKTRAVRNEQSDPERQ